MSGRLYFGVLSRRTPAPHALNLQGRLQQRFWSRATKSEERPSEMTSKLLSFKDFKENEVESWESFKESKIVKVVCGSDVEKTKKAYERFCQAEYSRYKHQAYGGNPSRMT